MKEYVERMVFSRDKAYRTLQTMVVFEDVIKPYPAIVENMVSS
jgi:hypothetical protein